MAVLLKSTSDCHALTRTSQCSSEQKKRKPNKNNKNGHIPSLQST